MQSLRFLGSYQRSDMGSHEKPSGEQLIQLSSRARQGVKMAIRKRRTQ
jgi:hypothetical protein